jgi:endonuclease/exonuclease/phosphatase family metal-dependent hydrolase
LAGVALAAGLATVAPGVSTTATAVPPRELTAVTFNIAHGHLAGNDLARIAAALRPVRADVIALQEVDRSWSRSGSVDQAAELARRLGMRHVFDSNLDCGPRDQDGDGYCRYGTAILSRHPVVPGSVRAYVLPTPAAEEPRGLARVTLNVAGRPVDVFNTHLSFVEPTRVRQVEAVKARLAGLRRPFVLMGDLNALPFHLEMVSLRRTTRDAAIAAGQPGLRTTNLARPVRLDYIMLPRPPLTGPPARVEALDARVVYAPRVSDHRPLIARLRLPAT